MAFKDTINKFREQLFPTAQQKEYNSAVTQLVNAIKNQRSLYKKEIKEWQMARRVAIDPENPRRQLLINLYEDMLTDAVLFAKAETRKLRISNKGYVITSKKGDKSEINEEKTKLLQKSWFNNFLKYSVENSYFGYAVLYPKELDANGYIKKLELIFRQNIIPEKQILLKDPGDQDGISIKEGAYAKWLFFMEDQNNRLGILDKAAPLWIFKKHSWQNWDEFAELFGIPIRTAKVASTDKRVLAEIDKWLKDLGSAAWGRFPEGVEVDIKESSSRDAFNVFNEMRKAANEELAILFDGNFETTNETGSRAKAGDVIKSTQGLIELDDEMRVQYLVNDDLLPWLTELGYPFDENDEFIWNYNEQSTPKERLEIFKGVKDLGYKVKKEQVAEELDVELEDEEEPEEPEPPKPKPGKKDENEDDPENKRTGFNPPHAHTTDCGCGAEYREIDFALLNALTDDEEEFLRQLWENPDSIKWNYKEFKASWNELLDGLKQGFGSVDFDFDSPDSLTMEFFQANVHRFAADKTQKEIEDLNKIIKSSKTFSEFRERAKRLFPNYKENWLRAEWNQAWTSSQMGARYIEMMKNIDVAPYWRLVAILDGHTTFMCSQLHGKVFRKDDPKCWVFLPSNHWGCRSDGEDVLASYDGEVLTFEQAVALDPEGYERMVKQGFAINWGEGYCFTETQSYLNDSDMKPISFEDLSFKAFGLPGSEKLQGQNLAGRKFRFDKYRDKSGMARIEDARGLPVWIDQKTADKFKDTDQLLNLIQHPDEIYFDKTGDVHTHIYFLFGKEKSYRATVEFLDAKPVIKKISIIKNPDKVRKGLLIYSPKEKIEFRLIQYNNLDKSFVREGFNDSTGGFLARHLKHGKQELQENMAIGKLLADKGHSVVLQPITQGNVNFDALIDGIAWEFKTPKGYVNLSNSIFQNIKSAKRQAKNILINLTGNFNYSDLYAGIENAVRMDSSGKIKMIGIIHHDKLYIFSVEDIKSGYYKKIMK